MFKGALFKLKKEQLREILPSYGLSDYNQLFEENYDRLKADPDMLYWSISQLVAKLKIQGMNEATIDRAVKEQLISQTEEAVRNANANLMVTVYRGDDRDLNEIREAGGFYGLNNGNITVEHARIHINEINNVDWFQPWSTQTADRTSKIPYVATGKNEAHKGKHEYQIQLPLQGLEQSAITKPKIVTDTNDLATAKIIALYMREEILFLTGIPINYITKIR